MKLRVSSQHIEFGVQASAHFCPIALAFLDRGFSTSIGPNFVVFYTRDGLVIGDQTPLPLAAIKWIAQFEGANPVNPIEFDIDVPEEALAGA